MVGGQGVASNAALEGAMASNTPEQVVIRLYELISGPAEQERDWEGVAGLFHPEAILRSELRRPDGSHQSGRWTVEEFCEAAAAEYRKTGFWESEVSSRSLEYGHIAHVWSTYESRIETRDSPPVMRGINSVSLLRKDDEWRIVSLIFQIERGTQGIPEEYS